MTRPGRTDKQQARQAFRGLCRKIAVDALNAANASEYSKYERMVDNASRCKAGGAALERAAKKFAAIAAKESRRRR